VVRRFDKEDLKLEKWFMVFKKETHFTEVKEAFLIKLKIFSVDYYFMSHQTLKNGDNIFQ
jgi:hypothetical protein